MSFRGKKYFPNIQNYSKAVKVPDYLTLCFTLEVQVF